jgi:DNA-binding transcriptional ArsR family regulator
MKQPLTRAHAILHVVRSRILTALGGRDLTPRDLAKDLPDVPLGTLYRHLNILLEADMIEVVGERRVHGTVERTFRVKEGASYLTPQDLSSLTPEDLTGIIQVLTAGVSEAFNKFAAKAERPYHQGQFSMVTQPLYLSKEENEALREVIRSTVAKADRSPGPGLERRVISFFSVPDVTTV